MKLSIITINKNNALGLAKTCLSVVTQTYKDFEWLIIDGASSDNSVDIIKQYSENINFWISEPDSGIYNAMNKGIKQAVGEYLLFLNSGDFLLHPWTLQEVINELKTLNYSDVYYSDTIKDNYNIWKHPKKVTLNTFLPGMINHQNSLILRALFEHQLFDENFRIISDWYFFVTEIINYKISFLHIKTNISMYDTSGISRTNAKDILANERKIALKKLNLKLKNQIPIFKILKIMKYLLPYGLYKLVLLYRDRVYN